MQMNTQLLQEISYQIVDGNPWWGMALANEYLSAEECFHKALTIRFITRTKLENSKDELSKALSEGIKTSELSPDLKAQIGARSVRTPLVVAPPRKRTQQPRVAIRSRRCRQSNYRLAARGPVCRRRATIAQQLSLAAP